MSGTVAMPLDEVQSVVGQLKTLTHTIIDCWARQGETTDALEHVLVTLHAARRNLESEMQSALAERDLDVLRQAAAKRGAS